MRACPVPVNTAAAAANADIAIGRGPVPAIDIFPARSVAQSGQIWLVAAMLFLLTVSNGRPFWLSSAPPVTLLALCLIGWRGMSEILKQVSSKINAPIAWSLILMAIWTAMSTLSQLDGDTASALALRCVVPFIIYLSVVGIRLRPADERLCLLAIVAGSSIPLVSGLVVFYRDFGIPEMKDLLYARYDVNRMSLYMDATFGNVTHLGMYVLLVVPAVVAAISSGAVRRLATALYSVWLVVVVCNAIISGSRTAFAVGLAVTGLLIVTVRRNRLMVLAAVLLLVFGAAMLSADMFDQSLFIERFVPSIGSTGRDGSLDERLESIEIGWETLMRNPGFGIGPGKSSDYNVYDVPHQSVLMVASETGLVGGLAFLLLNVIVLFRTARHAIRAPRNPVDRRRLLWIIGPASWLLGGLLAGLIFNMSLALLWVGIAHVMFGLYGFHDDSQQVPSTIPVSATRN